MDESSQLTFYPLKTRIFRLGENLLDFVVGEVPLGWVRERMVLAVTSKIVSLAEKRVIEKSAVPKKQLIAQEADYNLGPTTHGCILTIKHGLLLPSSGIDESNSETDQYILYPEDPFGSARSLWQGLRERWKLKDLGVILTDSRSAPLRRGVVGVSLAHWGFRARKSLIDVPDLFSRQMRMTSVNIADSLAASATLVMGEAAEMRPLAIIGYEGIEFCESTDRGELNISPQEDLYFPLFKNLLQF